MPAPFHTITVERVSRGTVDERGVPAETWSEHLELRASNQPLTVEEVAQLSQGGPIAATHRIFIPGTPDITEADRIADGDRMFQIDGIVDPAGAHHHLEVMAHVVSEAA